MEQYILLSLVTLQELGICRRLLILEAKRLSIQFRSGAKQAHRAGQDLSLGRSWAFDVIDDDTTSSTQRVSSSRTAHRTASCGLEPHR